MTEGEDFIKDFFMKNKFEFRTEEMIDGLKNDSKSHRRADFYLPQYKVFVEFFGQYNLTEHKERYQEKRAVYIQNNIPCVFLYPENLGIIEYIFDRRMVYVLKRYKLEKELRKYTWKKFFHERLENVIYAGLCLVFMAGCSTILICIKNGFCSCQLFLLFSPIF